MEPNKSEHYKHQIRQASNRTDCNRSRDMGTKLGEMIAHLVPPYIGHPLLPHHPDRHGGRIAGEEEDEDQHVCDCDRQ